MGIMKEEMMNRDEEKRDEKLATILGISYGELSELDHFVEPDTNDEGTEIGTIVTLNNTSNKEIIKKLKYKPDGTGKIRLDPFVFPANQ
jgi:hypothetical protein